MKAQAPFMKEATSMATTAVYDIVTPIIFFGTSILLLRNMLSFSLLSLFSLSQYLFSAGRDRDISGQFYGRGAQYWHSLVHTQSSPSSKIGKVVIVNFITSVLL